MHSTKASFAYEGNPPIVGFGEAQEPIVHQVNPPLCEHSLEGTSEFAVDTTRAELRLECCAELFPVSRFWGPLFRVNIHSLFCSVLLSTQQ